MQCFDLYTLVDLSHLASYLVFQLFLFFLVDLVKAAIFVTCHQSLKRVTLLTNALVNDSSVGS